MKRFLFSLFGILPTFCFGQYHSMRMPQASPKVTEIQQLGITDIEINYSSPAVKGRNVWESVVPMNGNPIPWRIGANMNTTISFSTDVTINGQPLTAGSYGLHAIPTSDDWTLLFAKNDNLWGSYYLDTLNGIVLKVQATPQENHHSEQLDFEFKNRTDSSVQIAIEWEKLSVPFTVNVDLNQTTLNHFRHQLLGATTYAWEAWDAAAQWCLNRNTNLEEALTWADRSITGGYGGYAATRNFTNLTTKASILWALERTQESNDLIQEAIPLMNNPYDDYWVGKGLLDRGRNKLALSFFDQMIQKFPETWYVYLGATRAEYVNDNSKKALKHLEKVKSMAPESYGGYLADLETKIKSREKL